MPGPAGAAPPGAVPAPPGVVPPPAGFPPPPGFQAPVEPPKPDPYAAQQAAMAASLAAFYGAGQALPGNADDVKESVGKQRPIGLIIGIGVAGILGALVGYTVNFIKGQSEFIELGTEKAKDIKKEVEGVRGRVKAALDAFKETKPGEAPSVETIDKLANLDLTEPDATNKMFTPLLGTFNGKLVRSMFDYYNNVTAFFREVQLHAALTKNDRDVLTKCLKASAESAAKGPPPALGVTFDYSQKLPQAMLATLGGVVCPKEGETSCDPGDMKLRYRTSVSGQFQEKPAKGLPKDIVIPIQPTDLLKNVIVGDPNQLACRDYVRRIDRIRQTVTKLPELEKFVIEGLDDRIKNPPK
ncbi:MAG: hypothetical protein JNM40_07925 [Myxococcales bacterium]|nr:hypothetical protein [Myxococcales bacterium]